VVFRTEAEFVGERSTAREKVAPSEGVHLGKGLELIDRKVVYHALAFAGLTFKIDATQRNTEMMSAREVFAKAYMRREWLVSTAAPGTVPVRI